MVRSIKLLLCFTLAIAFTLASSSEESKRKGNVDQDIIVNLLNETKWTFIQHSQASTEEVAEMKEILRQLWQERQDEMHRKREEESNIIPQLQQEVRELREEGREDLRVLREECRENLRVLREEGHEDLHRFHSALDNVVTLQGLVIEMRERERHQQQQLQQQQLDLLALNTSITAKRRESELPRQMDINQLKESMSAMNDSFSSYRRESELTQQMDIKQLEESMSAMNDSFSSYRFEAEMQRDIREREGQQHQLDLDALNTSITVQGRESELARQMNINQVEESMSAMNDSFSSYSVVVEAQEELLQQCRNESQATSQALATQELRLYHHIEAITNRVAVEAQEELLQQYRNESQATSQNLAAQELRLYHHIEAITNHTRNKVVHNGGIASKCSGRKVLNATEGSLEVSSSDYVNNMNCSWRIVTPPYSIVTFTWSYFSTEPCCDYLLVKDATGREMRRLGGAASLSNLVVATNEVEVIFHTDGSVNAQSNSNYRGFHVNYEAQWTWLFSFT